MVLRGQASLVDALGALAIQDSSHVVLSHSYEGPNPGRTPVLHGFSPEFGVEPHRLGMQLCSGPEQADDVYWLLPGCKNGADVHLKHRVPRIDTDEL
jgi:hypothetical protein